MLPLFIHNSDQTTLIMYGSRCFKFIVHHCTCDFQKCKIQCRPFKRTCNSATVLPFYPQMPDLEALAQQVLAVDSSKSRADVLADLEYTKSADATLNRILDGQFLLGTELDPSKQVAQNDTLIILDSDEEVAEELPQRSPSRSSNPIISAEYDISEVVDDREKYAFSPGLPSSSCFDFNTKSDTLNIPIKKSSIRNERNETNQPETFVIDDEEAVENDLQLLDTDSLILNNCKPTSGRSQRLDDNASYGQKDKVQSLSPKNISGEEKDIIDFDYGEEQDNDELHLPSLPSLDDLTKDEDDNIEEEENIETRGTKRLDHINNSNADYDHGSGDTGDRKRKSVEEFNYLTDDDNPFGDDMERPTKKGKIDLWNCNLGSDKEDDVEHLPSATDFLEELMTQKSEKPMKAVDILEIEDSDDEGSISMSKAGSKSSFITSDRKGKRKATTVFLDDDDADDNDGDSDTPSPRQRPRYDNDYSSNQAGNVDAPLTAKEKRKLEAAEKKQKKAQLAEEKKRAKEQKQLEKKRQQLFEKENRIRSNRNLVLQEMILYVHPDFLATKPGQLLERVLRAKEAEVLRLDSDSHHTINWRRKTSSEWDVDSQAFIPLTNTKIVREPFKLVYLTALQFVERIQEKTMDSLIDVVSECDCQTLLMIEGLDQYYKKKLLHKRRQYDTQVRSAFQAQDEQQQGSSTARRKANSMTELIANGPEQATIEEYSNYLMLMKDVMFVLTKDDEDTASWIESLTTDLALGRYKSKNINNFYRVSKCGTDPQDTYIKMLQEIQLCTPSIAKSVISAYPSLQRLHKAYDRTRGTTAGELMLADLEVERSALQTRDRKINRVMSRKIYSIFTSDNPEEIIY